MFSVCVCGLFVNYCVWSYHAPFFVLSSVCVFVCLYSCGVWDVLYDGVRFLCVCVFFYVCACCVYCLNACGCALLVMYCVVLYVCLCVCVCACLRLRVIDCVML